MTVTVDTNILVYAANSDGPLHGPAIDLLESLVVERSLVHLFWPVLLGFVRIATHPSILPRPLPVAAALDNVEALLAVPHVRVHGEQDGFWSAARAAQLEVGGGNDVPDAHIVALMRQAGVRVIYTQDRGFRRFDGIEMRRLRDDPED